jgi:hypothetical protein
MALKNAKAQQAQAWLSNQFFQERLTLTITPSWQALTLAQLSTSSIRICLLHD